MVNQEDIEVNKDGVIARCDLCKQDKPKEDFAVWDMSFNRDESDMQQICPDCQRSFDEPEEEQKDDDDGHQDTFNIEMEGNEILYEKDAMEALKISNMLTEEGDDKNE